MKTKQKRFDMYQLFGDIGQPEQTGLIPNEADFDLGTPNLQRDEDVVLVASSTGMAECLVVRLKWRPEAERGLVTLISRLTIIIDGETYEFEQVETYEPTGSSLRPGRIVQYGSASSKLRLYIHSPYRRMRVIFNGQLSRIGAEGANKSIFMRLSFVTCPLAQIFDYLEQYDEDCVKEIYARKKPVRTQQQVISDLLLHDRHEQKIRLAGEYLMIDREAESPKRQKSFLLWGYHTRHFLPANRTQLERNISTCRLYAQLNNGQSFVLGQRKFDADEVEFGHTAFEIVPRVVSIDAPFELDWRSLSADTEEFEFSQLTSQTLTIGGLAKRKHSGGWFQIHANGKPGWAWLTLEDRVVNTSDENEAIARSRSERERALTGGLRARIGATLPEGDQPVVVSIEDERCANSKLVGAKAASLAQLLQFTRNCASDERCRVPFACVLTKSAHELLLLENPSINELVAKLIESVGRGDIASLRDSCKAIEEFVRAKARLPIAIADELWTQLERHYGTSAGAIQFAARSSSWGEDEEDMSAAGQLSTILNVPYDRDQLAGAILACYASKFSYENIEYKRQHGMPLDLPMAVVVQEMVQCEKAGVMFTCDPTTGDESLITITANYGLGESVVSAQADPDSISVRNRAFDVDTVKPREAVDSTNELTINEVTVGSKNVILTGDQQQQHQNYDKSKCCLSEEETLRLARCGREIKRFFWSQRRDIEWGFLGDELCLFQSRPVTGLDTYSALELRREIDKPSQAELGFYTRANIGEVMPYAISPLTLTYMTFNWSTMGSRLFSRCANEILHVPQCASEVYHESYHAFFNLRCSVLLPLSDETRSVLGKSMEIGFFGREMGVIPELVEASAGFPKTPNPFAGARFDWVTLPIRMFPSWKVTREMAVMEKLSADVKALKLAEGYDKNKLLGLYNQLRLVSRSMQNCWENHIVIIMFASNSNMILTALLSNYIKDPLKLSAATNKFLAISPDVVSAEIPARIKQMAEQIDAAGGKEELESFVALADDQALEYLRTRDQKLAKLFGEFMERFGHRCYNEFDLRQQAWREKPQQVADMVRKNCACLLSDHGAANKPVKSAESRPKTIDEVIKSLGVDMTLKDRLLVKHLLAPKSQLMLSLREKTKNILVKFTDVQRQASRMLAEELQRQLRIPDTDLLYFILFDELKALIEAPQPWVVCQATRRRQIFGRDFKELWKFDEIISDMTPLHLKPTRELSEAIAQAPKLTGTPASGGRVQAKICLVHSYKELDKVRAGTILLTHSTDIAFSPIFPLVSGIITEVGGLISHGAVVAREYGLPSVIGIPDVTRILQDGEEVILDADNGEIIRLSKSSTYTKTDQDSNHTN